MPERHESRLRHPDRRRQNGVSSVQFPMVGELNHRCMRRVVRVEARLFDKRSRLDRAVLLLK